MAHKPGEDAVYRCPRGGFHRFKRRKWMTVRVFGFPYPVRRLVCTKCRRPAGKAKLPPPK